MLLTNFVNNKLFYSISEVSRLTKIPTYILRYWEKEFKDLKPEKSSTGQRRYRYKDIETVKFIYKLLYQDMFSIKGAKRRIKELKKENKQLGFNLDRKEPNLSKVIEKLEEIRNLIQ